MCNFLEYKGGFLPPHDPFSPRTQTDYVIIDSKVVYRRYASLFFIAGCASTDNELITLEVVHRYVEQMDKYYGNVCELDIIFNFQKAYFILDELLIAGEMQETSKKNVLRCISQQDSLEDMEVSLARFLSFYFRFTFGIILWHIVFSSKRCYIAIFGCFVPLSPLPLTRYYPYSMRSAMAKFSRANYFRLRKMWSPRSCNTKQAGLPGVHRSLLFFNTNEYNFQDSEDINRNLEEVGL